MLKKIVETILLTSYIIALFKNSASETEQLKLGEYRIEVLSKGSSRDNCELPRKM